MTDFSLLTNLDRVLLDSYQLWLHINLFDQLNFIWILLHFNPSQIWIYARATLFDLIVWHATGLLSTVACWILLIQRKLFEASGSDVRFNMRISLEVKLLQLKNSNVSYHCGLRRRTNTYYISIKSPKPLCYTSSYYECLKNSWYRRWNDADHRLWYDTIEPYPTITKDELTSHLLKACKIELLEQTPFTLSDLEGDASPFMKLGLEEVQSYIATTGALNKINLHKGAPNKNPIGGHLTQDLSTFSS